MRMLDRAKVAYQTNVFEVTEEHQTGEQIAALVHANVEDVYKTLVLENANHDHFVFVIPVNATLDMKKLHMKQERKIKFNAFRSAQTSDRIY